MNKALHEVEISGDYGTAKIYIDGEETHGIRGYTIEHDACEIPQVELRLACVSENVAETQATIQFANTDLIAKLFSREQFDEFCRLWEEYHERSEGQTRDNRKN